MPVPKLASYFAYIHSYGEMDFIKINRNKIIINEMLVFSQVLRDPDYLVMRPTLIARD